MYKKQSRILAAKREGHLDLEGGSKSEDDTMVGGLQDSINSEALPIDDAENVPGPSTPKLAK